MAKLIGTNPNQVPTNADLGDMAYKNGDNLKAGPLTVVDESVSIGGQAPTTVFDINVERPIGTTIRLYGSNNSGEQTLYESFNGKDFRVGIENSTGSLGYGSAAYDRYLFSEGSFPITFSTDSTERMRIWQNGEVRKQYQPAFLLYTTTTTQTTSSSAWANITMNNEAYDVGGNFASSTFTAPVTGKYQMNVQLLVSAIDTAAGYYVFDCTTSNRNYHHLLYPGTILTQDGTFQIIWSFVADMDAGDTASLRFLQNGGTFNQTTVVADPNYTRWTGYMMG